MKLPFLASFLILIGIVFYRINRSNHEYKKEETDFWEREKKANATRKKSLDHLPYITIPKSLLSLHCSPSDTELSECITNLKSLSLLKIVNFTGVSNTDLKLAYGTANITVLTEYDLNYTTLARILQKTSELLYDAGRIDDALLYLEFAISTGTDVSKTYFLLADIYKERQDTGKIQHLITQAESIPSLMKQAIVRTLRESYL